MMKAIRCGSILSLAWMGCLAAGPARADFVTISPFDEAAAAFIPAIQPGPITYPGGGPFLGAEIRADSYAESAILFDLQPFRSLGATITHAELTVRAVAYASRGPSGAVLVAGALSNTTGMLNAPDFPTPSTPVPFIGSATLPTPDSSPDDTADVPLTFDVTSFLSGQLASGAGIAGIIFRVETLGDVVVLASRSAPAMAGPPSLAVTFTVPEPSSLLLCGIAALAGLGIAHARRRAA